MSTVSGRPASSPQNSLDLFAQRQPAQAGQRKNWRRLAGAVSLFLAGLVLMVSAPPAALRAEATPATCGLRVSGALDRADVPDGIDTGKCQLVGRMIDGGALSLEVPRPGQGVSITAERADGGSDSFALRTDDDGDLHYAGAVGSGLTPPSISTSSMAWDGCDLDAATYGTFDVLGAKLYEAQGMWVGDGGQPAGASRAKTGDTINDAGKVWRDEVSPCNTVDRSAAPRIYYAGDTSLEGDFKNVDGTTTCAEPDSKSTVDSGNLDRSGSGSYVALNCSWWYSAGSVYQTDIRFNTYNYDFTYTPHSGCDASRTYDVMSIMVHELGHTHGLLDHYQNWEFYQSMYGRGDPCTTHGRDLGVMDLREIRKQY